MKAFQGSHVEYIFPNCFISALCVDPVQISSGMLRGTLKNVAEQ